MLCQINFEHLLITFPFIQIMNVDNKSIRHVRSIVYLQEYLKETVTFDHIYMYLH